LPVISPSGADDPMSAKKTSGRIVVRCRDQFVRYLAASIGCFILAAFVLFAILILRAENRGVFTLFIGSTVACISTGAFAIRLGIIRPQLVLGGGYLELRHGLGKGRIVGQIPISNIGSVDSERKTKQVFGFLGWKEVTYFAVMITPIKAKDDETWWPGYFNKKGEAFEIADEYVKSPSWIKGRITTLAAQHRDTVTSLRP
jgi:hypothetical protein